jgi:DNA-directed RNA polymerase I subunit RPA1
VDIALQPPAILKPQPLWSGKQVVATVVAHFTAPAPPLTFTGGSKVRRAPASDAPLDPAP